MPRSTRLRCRCTPYLLAVVVISGVAQASSVPATHPVAPSARVTAVSQGACGDVEAAHPVVEVAPAEEDAAAFVFLVERDLPPRDKLPHALRADVEVAGRGLDRHPFRPRLAPAGGAEGGEKALAHRGGERLDHGVRDRKAKFRALGHGVTSFPQAVQPGRGLPRANSSSLVAAGYMCSISS